MEESEHRKFGYARVSSRDQNLARQLAALREAGIKQTFLYTDKQSGKDFNRPSYRRMVKRLRKGDELYIKSIDRLGRNYDEILEQWRYLTREKGADIIILDFPLLDTRHSEHGLTGEFISDITLQILSYAAQIERENIHQRQMEGIKEAKNRGVHFGRPKIEIPDQFADVSREISEGMLSLRAGAARLGISHTTLRKWIKSYENPKKNWD